MRRILLIVVMLLLATAPAMATVTVTAKQHAASNALGQYTATGRQCNMIDVTYSCGAGELVRAFALELTLDNGFVISGIDGYVRGESNSVTPGYGIFPGSFRNVLTPEDVNWANPDYNPIASTDDPDAAGTGLGTNKVILEMGSLYVGDGNKPTSAGTLCRLTVTPKYRGADTNGFGPAEATMTFAVNTLRGGVVLESGASVTPTVVSQNASGVANKFSLMKTFPCWEPYRLQYNEWLSIWEPRCWSGWQVADANWRVQCLGDADNKTETLSKFRVYSSDYNLLVAGWAKKATILRTPVNGMCCDFDHKSETLSKFRCYSSDYSILVANWAKKETTMKVWCPRP
jgi:hypothetical protein